MMAMHPAPLSPNCSPNCARLQAKLYPRILAAMKPGSTLGLSHGFLLGVMQVGTGTNRCSCVWKCVVLPPPRDAWHSPNQAAATRLAQLVSHSLSTHPRMVSCVGC